MDERPATVRLQDYRPPDYEVVDLALDFDLHPTATVVVARTHFRRLAAGPCPLVLDGRTFVRRHLAIDGRPLGADEFRERAGKLELPAPPADFTLEATTELDPEHNTALEGLYLSGGRYCTQCEAEGFRTITYALDRPDVMTRFTVRIVADQQACPTLLSNGDCVAAGPLPDGRHFARFVDPHKKPTYLFALAAGRYETLAADFTTASGSAVRLAVHVDPGELDRAHYALDSLLRAMRWDEQRFLREYDLSAYHIVAVRDFNFGAMENKGLNLFNSAYVLADPATATDADYESIEAVVGHEYFHNWTGNRITCRDWFQLSLKEGLTVYREHEFSADMRSRAVQRIKDVKRLRARQFVEDQGPLAHPVRPTSYQAIDNFYTATVYEKGAEVIRMLQQAIGDEAFARGLQLYFARRDGTASTVEDLLACLADAAGRDLSPFLGWYDQAGTPHVTVRCAWDAGSRRATLHVTQRTPPTPGQPDKRPLPIPLRIGFCGQRGPLAATFAGCTAAEHTVLFADAAATLVFTDVAEAPVPAVLRGFSAPVVLDDGLTDDQRLQLCTHDPDPFTRWEAGQQLARQAMLAAAAGAPPTLAGLTAALARELDRAGPDPAFAALALTLPDLPELVQTAARPDPDALQRGRDVVRHRVASTLRDRLAALVMAPGAPFSPAPAAAGPRALRAAALDLLAALGADTEALLWQSFTQATDMTATMAALHALGSGPGERFDAALATFHARWRHVPLVLDKWFAAQATAPRADALARVQRLRGHPDFDLHNPNRVRALGKAFASYNLRAFHAADGSGYEFLGALVADVDPRNPALASKLVQPFESWRRFDAARQAHAQRVLAGLAALPHLSPNSREMVERTLG